MAWSKNEENYALHAEREREKENAISCLLLLPERLRRTARKRKDIKSLQRNVLEKGMEKSLPTTTVSKSRLQAVKGIKGAFRRNEGLHQCAIFWTGKRDPRKRRCKDRPFPFPRENIEQRT